MKAKENVIKSKIELLQKNSAYVFGADNLKYVDNSLVEVKDGHARGLATITLIGGVDTSKLLRFMEFYPVIRITPGCDEIWLIIDTEKMNEEEAEEVTEIA